MKITKAQLKQLIKEELQQSIDEAWDAHGNWKSRYSSRRDVEPETDEARKYRREREAREDERRREAGLPPIKSKYFEESDDGYKPGMRDEHVYSEGEIRFIQRSLEKAITRAFDTLRDGSAVERERAVRDAFEPAMEEAMRMLHGDE